jgi:hypothetical protein
VNKIAQSVWPIAYNLIKVPSDSILCLSPSIDLEISHTIDMTSTTDMPVNEQPTQYCIDYATTVIIGSGMNISSRLHRLTINEDNLGSLTGVGNGSRFVVVNFLRRSSSQFARDELFSGFLDHFYPIYPIFPLTYLRDLFTNLFVNSDHPNPAIHAFCCAVLSFGAKILHDEKESHHLYRLSGSILARQDSLDPLYAFVTYLLLVFSQKQSN